MDVSYRVNAKLLRFHASRIQHPLNGRGTPEIFTEERFRTTPFDFSGADRFGKGILRREIPVATSLALS